MDDIEAALAKYERPPTINLCPYQGIRLMAWAGRTSGGVDEIHIMFFAEDAKTRKVVGKLTLTPAQWGMFIDQHEEIGALVRAHTAADVKIEK